MSDPMSASVSALDSDPKTLAAIREKAAAILSDIDSKSAEGEAPSSSWVRGVGADDDRQDVTARCQFFDRNGFIHIPGFASESEIDDMKQQMEDLANKEWDPAAKTSVFRTDHGQTKAQGSDDYFLSSASRVHFFAEKDATNVDGSLKPEFANNKVSTLYGGRGYHRIGMPVPQHTYVNSLSYLPHTFVGGCPQQSWPCDAHYSWCFSRLYDFEESERSRW